MMQQLGLILQQLEEISEQIDESLKQRIIRSNHTNDYYEKIKKHLMRLEDWNTKIISMINMKEGTKLEKLLEASRNTSEELRKLREKLNVLRDKAETNIAFKNYEYQEMKEIQLPKFHEYPIQFIEEIRKITINTNFNLNILEKIIKKNVEKQIYEIL